MEDIYAILFYKFKRYQIVLVILEEFFIILNISEGFLSFFKTLIQP